MSGHNELFCKRCKGTNTHKMMTPNIALCDVCNWINYVPSQEDFDDVAEERGSEPGDD